MPEPTRLKKYPLSALVSNARRRARVDNLPFDITSKSMVEQWEAQNGLCYWTGVGMDFQSGCAQDPLRPSLDRLVPHEGYVNGNVVWSSQFANRGRGPATVEVFKGILEKLGLAKGRRPVDSDFAPLA